MRLTDKVPHFELAVMQNHDRIEEDPRSLAQTSSPATSDPFEGVIDLLATADRLPRGWDAVPDFARLLLTESARTMNEIQLAISRSDAPALQRAAHTLKGSADIFGAELVVATALSIEECGRNGDVEGAREQLSELELQVSRLSAALRALTGKD